MSSRPFDKDTDLPEGTDVWLIKEKRWGRIIVCLKGANIMGVRSIKRCIPKERCSLYPPNTTKDKLTKLLKEA